MALQVNFARWDLELHSASELRAALRTTLGDAEYCGGPYALVGRDVDVPAWGWLGEACLLRSDWLPAVAAAVLDVAQTATPMERKALVDLLANEPATVRLLHWTAGLATQCGDWTGTRAGTGWGGSNTAPQLAHVLANHERYAAAWTAPHHELVLSEGARPKLLPLGNLAELRAALQHTAAKGVGPSNTLGDAAWDWLAYEVAFVPWVAAALPDTLQWALHDDPGLAYAALDYLLLGQDSGRWLDLAMELRRKPRPWAAEQVRKKPKGWHRPLRGSGDPSLKTLGDAAIRLGTIAQRQAGHPVLDLPLP